MRPNPCLKESLRFVQCSFNHNRNNPKGVPPTISRVSPEFSWNHKFFHNHPTKLGLLTAIQRFFLAVGAPAVPLPDNSGTNIRWLPQFSKPASAHAAIPRTSNPLQACNSLAHRNVRIAFP
jgi:hypothetical protein